MHCYIQQYWFQVIQFENNTNSLDSVKMTIAQQFF